MSSYGIFLFIALTLSVIAVVAKIRKIIKYLRNLEEQNRLLQMRSEALDQMQETISEVGASLQTQTRMAIDLIRGFRDKLDDETSAARVASAIEAIMEAVEESAILLDYGNEEAKKRVADHELGQMAQTISDLVDSNKGPLASAIKSEVEGIAKNVGEGAEDETPG